MLDIDDDDVDIDLFRDNPGMRMVLPIDEAGEFDDEEIADFYGRAYNKMQGPTEIAWALGWSPRKLKQFLENDERAELLEFVKEAHHEGMERAVYVAGRKHHNMTAARLWLFCQARHRGWSDTRQVHVTAQSRAEVLISIAQGTQEAIRAGVATYGEDAIAALQARYVTVDEDAGADIIDAFVVGSEDDDAD